MVKSIMKKISSESTFLIKMIVDLLCLPLRLIGVIRKKKKPYVLVEPIENFVEFVTEPKFTFSIILITMMTSVLSVIFLNEQQFYNLLVFPTDIFHPLRWYSFLTSGFIHAGWTHLFGNMVAVFIFGRIVERKIGAYKTAMIYFIAMLVSSIGSSLFNLIVGDLTPALGASGAIMGLISAAILIDPFYLTYELIVPLPVMIIGWLTVYLDFIGVLYPMNDNVGHLAHLLGFMSITVTFFLFEDVHKKNIKKGLLINILSLIIFISIISFGKF